MTYYRIEVLTPDGWIEDASLLAHGCAQVFSSWPTQAQASAVMAELVRYGFSADRMRVVPVESAA